MATLPEGMEKKIIQEGEGDESPTDGSEVTVHYTGTLENGDEFDSSHSRQEPFCFTLGSGSVIKGWDIALRTMKRSEISEFSLPPELAYGEQGSPPSIPPNSRLKFIIELIDWELEKASFDKSIYKLTIEERLEKCSEKNQTGGRYFKEGKYDVAVRHYRDLMKYAEISEFSEVGDVVELDSVQTIESDSKTKDKKAELRQMLLVGHLNLALCYLRLNKIKDCIANCDSALAIHPSNVKALFRKGLAFSSTNDFEKALEQFDKVLELDPANVEAKNQRASCNTALRNYYQKQKDIYKNLFASKKS